MFCFLKRLDDYFIALIQNLLIQAFSEFNQKGWLERCLILKAGKPYKVLKIRSFLDCLRSLSVGKSEPLLNNKGSQSLSERMSRPSAFTWEVDRIQVLKLLPGDQIPQTDPFVVFVELHTATLIEIIKPDLRRCAGSIHGIWLAF